ncbi:unnamed protein product [Gongylonema pulchrum]|uniref:ABC transporter substrate-binding protein n=1 Tax=Gongylonema pulchrum TaxID=637853 RepID=A0A183DZM3_9BILA|nr:unnamed protein product [Gongylonema pulchrum]
MCGSSCMLFAIPGYGPYASSKAALGAYTDVIMIMPGSFESGMQDTGRLLRMMDNVWNRSSQEIRNEYGSDYNDKAKAVVKQLQSKLIAKDITWVIEAYYEAIAAKRPKLLYRIGWDAVLL